MKKNKMMRMAAVLMVAVLATTCALSGSFAKYVGESSAEDSARVAAFGINADVSGDATIFSTTYATNDGEALASVGANSVISSTEDKVLAPGTSGTIAAAKLSGTAEVAVKVGTDNVSVDASDWYLEDEETFYCPITITCGSASVCGLDYEDAESFDEDVQALIESDMEVYIPAGKDLDGADNATYQGTDLTWSWAFEDAEGDEMEQSDENDTYLGNLATAYLAAEELQPDQEAVSAPSITITMDITVTQVD